MTHSFLQLQALGDLPFPNTDEKLAGLAFQACRFSVADYDDHAPQSCSISIPPGFERFVGKRKAEFVAGRVCAQQALERLGVHDAQIAIGENRAPVWPAGILGSISHSHEYACCVAARASANGLNGIGIDAEQIMIAERADKLYGHIVSESEKHYLQTLNCSWPTALTLVFSAKESLFKTLYPAVLQYFDFLHAEVIAIDLSQQRLSLRLLKDLTAEVRQGNIYDGLFAIEADSVQTLVYY
ncbi:4'-phosphopantetheinyl transferase family protein [Gynuella sunshinyii]|uniref:Enterobactin synthase component D n=1 Tax=Gynuella sunshinyii YC6258 TaxID=1445510 RepID=A0A0C5VIV1_9GAMM|nr:4'-phosphopantetheinyl transferase superfamily protein [Gynuella sunshinyii]AJQ93268.1 phosphopantetheinyl transferase component of siderophore synthetase [Gynuella sunshinyii YC6258]